jgi:enoyl-CoA hydratase/carnithine racemase
MTRAHTLGFLRSNFALNEVPIGIPMPAVYVEIIKHALGAPAAAEMTLFGHVYDLADAYRLRIMNHIVPAERLTRPSPGRVGSSQCAIRPTAIRNALCRRVRCGPSTRPGAWTRICSRVA